MSTTSNPLVSIIVCCHNREHYLGQAVESALGQQYKPVEIVIVDDGSTDGTPQLMDVYKNKIRYYRQERQGIASARTTGGRLSKGELIAFLDDDDLMPPARIVLLYEAMRKHPDTVFAVGDWLAIDNEGKTTSRRWLPRKSSPHDRPTQINDGCKAVLWPQVAAAPHTTLFRRTDGEKVGWFDERFNIGSL